MKRFFQTSLFAIAIIAVCSCDELQKDGAWDPIELDKDNLEFSSQGGQETVTALNYTSWWISGGYEVTCIDDQKIKSDYIHASSSDGEETHTYDLLDGGWYHVTVPDKGKSNTIIITVDPLSGDGNPREAIIEMQAGDAFTKISIAQK